LAGKILVAVWALVGLASIPPVIITPFLFDAPGSESSPLTIAFAIAVVLLPVCFLIGAIVWWVARWRGAFFLIPLIDIAAIVAVVVAMESVCGGNLAC
jgi:hypothetical protein